MAIIVGTDTYLTVAEADAYAASIGASWPLWTAADEATKEAALRVAARYLDRSYNWCGSIADIEQDMSWPRVNVADREGREIDTVPDAVQWAQAELANMSLAGALVQDASSGEVTQITAGSVSLTFKDGQSASEGQRFRSVDRLLTGLYEGRAGGVASNRKLSRA